MSEAEETYNGGFAYKRVPRHQIRDGNFSSTLEDAGISSATGDHFRTYKRRKNMLNFRSGGVFERESLEALPRNSSQSTSRKEGTNCSNVASMNHLPSDCARKWRTFVLQKMYESLKTDDDGIKGYIKEALLMESDSPEVLDTGTQSLTVSEFLKRAFFRIILSEKFTLLCKFLFNVFESIKFENFLCLSIIDRNMRDGTYEQSPLLFSSDIQQLLTEFQKIGDDLVSISTSLLDFSKMSLNELADYNFQKPSAVHQVLACRHCGGKASTKDCLVCDSCEQMYHVSCIVPAIKTIPTSWHCLACSTATFSSETHRNCVVCEKLAVESPHSTASFDEEHSDNSEGTSNNTRSSMKATLGVCKLCGIEVGGSMNIKICQHESCPFKWFHSRCLTKRQMQSHGPCWYCPSCLCRTCLTDKDDHKIVLCDCCDNAYHIYCLTPPWATIPRGKWLCRQCKLKLRIIRKAKRAHEKIQTKGKPAGRMDLLLSAAFNCTQ